MSSASRYSVRGVHCDHRAGAEEVYQALARATSPLERVWEKLSRAGRIAIKFNQAWPPDQVRWFAGQRQELVSDHVARATLRLLRERTTAELVCVEIAVDKKDRDPDPGPWFTLLPLLREFGVQLIDGDRPPHRSYAVPGGGLMFKQYLLPEDVMECDAFVDVQKMKSHLFAGVTLCMKNLFGLCPEEPYGRGRQYFHHLIRLPQVLADLGALVHPTLSIIDALVAQSDREWGGSPRIADALVAGDHVLATDAYGAHLMGHDPAADWPTQPYVRDTNALLAAAQGGYGVVNLREIDIESELTAPLAEFHTLQIDSPQTVYGWRWGACEQALYYRDHARDYYDRYAGQYILLQDFQVVWHGDSSALSVSRRQLAGEQKEKALWFKLVDPDEHEGEHYEVYERMLAQMRALAPAPQA